MNANVYSDLFEAHRSTSIPELWPWQTEVLAEYGTIDGDAAVELPTGAGKTLIGLLAGEEQRQAKDSRIAYVAGNKQLAQQVERQATELDFPVVRFEGSKDGWDSSLVRKYNFGQAIGVMNYWNYFNAAPGVEPADMLILDDVHLLEGRLREMFTLTIGRSDQLLDEILKRIAERFPYYAMAEDLLADVEVTKPAEMLAFPDSADLAGEVRDLLDARLEEYTAPWWPWQKIREQLEVCSWLVSRRGITLTPFIPPTQTIDHFEAPARRLYLSATIGSVDDLQRRLGVPPLDLLVASVQPRQGERLVVIRDDVEPLDERELVEALGPLLEEEQKALWLCARKDTAENVHDALLYSELDGEVRILEGDNAADAPFAEEDDGHLVTAGRYDGMDFPGDSCRLEIIPEVPVATSDLEDFVSAFLRDAPFAQVRFGQRIAQALGRCNRQEDDRAVYLLTDPEFQGKFSQRQVADALPGHVREDVLSASIRAEKGLDVGLEEAVAFLDGDVPEYVTCPPRGTAAALPETAAAEVGGILAMWNGNFSGAAEEFDRVARELGDFREYRGFWLAMRALALKRAADLGDRAAGRREAEALRAAVSAGGQNVFFSRMRLSAAREEGDGPGASVEGFDDLFVAWDRLMDKLGPSGPRFDKWAERLLAEVGDVEHHDAMAAGISRVAMELLGLEAGTPKAKQGEEDAYWELVGPRRLLAFEVKTSPKRNGVVNDDVEQAEGAVRAAANDRGYEARGLLVTPFDSVDDTAVARLERVRLITVDAFIAQVERILGVLRDYRREWTVEASGREAARERAVDRLPQPDWMWRASLGVDDWVTEDALGRAWDQRVG